MKKSVSLFLIISLLISLFCGCGRQIRYGGTDTNGNTAADVVKLYYESLDNDNDEMYYFTDSYKNSDIKQQEISLIEFSACEVVNEDDIRESDREWVEEIQNDYSYTLVLETEDSEWKIYDFGYPPHCTVEK